MATSSSEQKCEEEKKDPKSTYLAKTRFRLRCPGQKRVCKKEVISWDDFSGKGSTGVPVRTLLGK